MARKNSSICRPCRSLLLNRKLEVEDVVMLLLLEAELLEEERVSAKNSRNTSKPLALLQIALKEETSVMSRLMSCKTVRELRRRTLESAVGDRGRVDEAAAIATAIAVADDV